jgi:KRAB domain-containing zinc finger protein
VKKEHSEFFDEFSRKYEVTPCEVCGKKFINMSLLYHHRRKVHPELMQDVILPDGKKKIGRRRVFTIDDGLPYLADRKCDHCGQILADIRQWTDHVQAHTTGYSCDICGKKFKVGVTHRRHMRTHETSLTPLLCNQCGSTFTTEFDYEKHNRRHSFDKFRKSNKKSDKKEETFFGLCNVCGKKFTVKTAYDYHVKTAHLEEHELFKCPHCPSTFRDKGVYEHHLPLHFDPTLPCPHCDKMFKTKHYLRNHMRAAHVPDEMKKFVCGQCGKGFTERNTYEGHVNMHLGLKPYRCRYCDMRYQNASNKLNHEKSRHPDLYTTQKTNPMAGISVAKRDQMLATRDS